MIKSIAIIGANLAGCRTAGALRRHGFEGRILLVGDEPLLPYERPPLSKDVLWQDGFEQDRLLIADAQWYDANRIELHLGVRAEGLDMAGSAVRLATGPSLPADRIVLATGGRTRRLSMPGAECGNVHYLRTRGDADRLRAALVPGARIAVLGMGVIGAEVAASARKIGCSVTAIEPAPAPMVRGLGARFGAWLAQKHADAGVRTLFQRSASDLVVSDGAVRAVRLDDGTRVDCDAVVVGIGIIPSVELARSAGITIGNGIVVDRQCRTSHPSVYAAGDVADQPCFFGGRTRMETYQNAADQGAAVATAILGLPTDYLRPSWFWSDQYDLNIQVAGRIADDCPQTVRGDPDSDAFSVFFFRDGVVEGVLTVNRPADMGVGRRLVESRAIVDPKLLSDPAIALRTVLGTRHHAA